VRLGGGAGRSGTTGAQYRSLVATNNVMLHRCRRTVALVPGRRNRRRERRKLKGEGELLAREKGCKVEEVTRYRRVIRLWIRSYRGSERSNYYDRFVPTDRSVSNTNSLSEQRAR
jgi:hypothetical protein